jgi:archaellum component FlaC
MEALKMETPMTEWNDDRLDEMNGRMKEGFTEVDERFDKVDERFDKVDERFVRLEGEMKGGFAKANGDLKEVTNLDRNMKEGFAKVDREMKEGFADLKAEIQRMGDRLEKRIDRVSNRLDRLMFTLIAAGCGVLVAALNGGLS